MGTWRGEGVCSKLMTCRPLHTFGVLRMAFGHNLHILRFYGHLVGPGGLLKANYLPPSSIPSVFCAWRLDITCTSCDSMGTWRNRVRTGEGAAWHGQVHTQILTLIVSPPTKSDNSKQGEDR